MAHQFNNYNDVKNWHKTKKVAEGMVKKNDSNAQPCSSNGLAPLSTHETLLKMQAVRSFVMNLSDQPSTNTSDAFKQLQQNQLMQPPFRIDSESFSAKHQRFNTNCCFSCVKFWLMCSVICCYVGCPPLPEVITRKLAFHPPRCGYALSYTAPNGRIVEVTSAKKAFGKSSLNRQFMIKPQSTSSTEVVILIAQPNGSDLGDLQSFQRFCDVLLHGASVFVFDYSGYGVSTGRPSEANIYEDLRTVYSAICKMKPNAKIVLVGLSIGTATCIELASSNPNQLSGLILIAAFTSGCRLLRKDPERVETQCFDRFRSIEKVSKIDVPTLVIHGTHDQFVPPEHSAVIYAKLKRPVLPLFVDGAAHNDIIDTDNYPEVQTRMREFVKKEIM